MRLSLHICRQKVSAQYAPERNYSTVLRNVVNLRVNDIDNIYSCAIIVTFMSAIKLTRNIRRNSIPQQSWAPPLSQSRHLPLPSFRGSQDVRMLANR